jgi:hypothetical protein
MFAMFLTKNIPSPSILPFLPSLFVVLILAATASAACDPTGLRNATSADEVVRLAYCVLLDRDPLNSDPAYHNWTEQITGATLSPHDLLLKIFDSQEFQAEIQNLSNADYVQFLYARVLRTAKRSADDPGPLQWVSSLNEGRLNRRSEFQGFIDSQEFKGDYPGLQRTFAVCNTGPSGGCGVIHVDRVTQCCPKGQHPEFNCQSCGIECQKPVAACVPDPPPQLKNLGTLPKFACRLSKNIPPGWVITSIDTDVDCQKATGMTVDNRMALENINNLRFKSGVCQSSPLPVGWRVEALGSIDPTCGSQLLLNRRETIVR